MYCLQSRWVLKGRRLIYYGLRNAAQLFHNEIRLSRRQAAVIAALPKELTAAEQRCLKKLLNVCVVEEEARRYVPKSLKEAAFCRHCCANDYMIPGLEFDERGLCPLCQTEKDTARLRSIIPLVRDIPPAADAPYDVALFYTGGKDSTFLLHYLARVLGRRVLALTWEIPFMSDSAKLSIARARERFPDVTFLSRAVDPDDLRRIYRKLYELNENTCACPSMAYVMFYPDLVRLRVPCFTVGNEPAQLLGLYYNHMAPKIAYSFPDNAVLNGLINIGRVLTLHPPLKRGQFHTLTTMKKLAYGGGLLQKLSGYQNELVDNVVTAIHEVPHLLEPLRKSLRESSRTGRIPAFVQLDFDEICGGVYDWNAVNQQIAEECGWVAPQADDKGLHTSCDIERCKEYSQFVRFYHCRSRMIPFSALEIALAGRGRNLSREEAIREIEHSCGFSLDEIPECARMRSVLQEQT